jgi:hypothetical protein
MRGHLCLETGPVCTHSNAYSVNANDRGQLDQFAAKKGEAGIASFATAIGEQIGSRVGETQGPYAEAAEHLDAPQMRLDHRHWLYLYQTLPRCSARVECPHEPTGVVDNPDGEDPEPNR